MNLFSNSVWIFVLILLLLLFAGLFPTPAMIGIAALVSSFLVILQAVIILKDKG